MEGNIINFMDKIMQDFSIELNLAFKKFDYAMLPEEIDACNAEITAIQKRMDCYRLKFAPSSNIKESEVNNENLH